MTTYTVSRGATLSLYLEAISGDPTTATNAVAKIAPLPISPRVAAFQGGLSSPAVASALQVTLQTTSPGLDPSTGLPIGPGWYVTLGASLSATLAAGSYVVDMAFQVGTAEIVSDQIFVQIINAVSIP